VRIALTLDALNDLDVKMADIENAYLTETITEKVWTVLGPDFGNDAGKSALIVRALCGHIAECMKHLGWNRCCVDMDLLTMN
jgi:hypothetical protein